MKKMIIIILLLNLVGCGTDQGKGKTYTYTVKNMSGRDIKIDAYQASITNIGLKTMYLENGEEITKIFKSPGPPLQEYYDFIRFFQGDSVVVTFDNEKVETFVLELSCEGDERNPLNMCFYSDQEETFIFTEEDYENAVPCDGSCN